VSTIDADISLDIKKMFESLRKTPNYQSGKFRMISTYPSQVSMSMMVTSSNTTQKEKEKNDQKWKQKQKDSKKITRVFQNCNSRAYISSNEVIMAEMELL